MYVPCQDLLCSPKILLNEARSAEFAKFVPSELLNKYYRCYFIAALHSLVERGQASNDTTCCMDRAML